MRSWGLFTDPATIYMIKLINVHNIIMTYVLVIAIFVTWLIVQIVRRFLLYMIIPRGRRDVRRRRYAYRSRHLSHDPTSEMIWTSFPAGILIAIAVPSFNLLYASDILGNIDMSIKIIGYQWYWKYNYTGEAVTWLAEKGIIDINLDKEKKNVISVINHNDFNQSLSTKEEVIQTITKIIKDMKNWKFVKYNPMQITIESNMISDNLITIENLRLLTVDNPLILPVNTNIRLLITSHDVLHSWAVPAFGIKTDACPSRLNQTFLNVFREGVFYGQCSELCGVKHGFMPIQVIITTV